MSVAGLFLAHSWPKCIERHSCAAIRGGRRYGMIRLEERREVEFRKWEWQVTTASDTHTPTETSDRSRVRYRFCIACGASGSEESVGLQSVWYFLKTAICLRAYRRQEWLRGGRAIQRHGSVLVGRLLVTRASKFCWSFSANRPTSARKCQSLTGTLWGHQSSRTWATRCDLVRGLLALGSWRRETSRRGKAASRWQLAVLAKAASAWVLAGFRSSVACRQLAGDDLAVVQSSGGRRRWVLNVRA
jgi:hypothetical protein